ncbi:MAG: hypothetical protein H6815_12590 [Phycisphaeraceae bacterium]|nr:hypothetical protein [Phycisphaerales bacterium]MCB9861279.1 hypothetical protein [Phycisphaeraceae bacterium]
MTGTQNPKSSTSITGHVLALFAFDIGFQINLDAAEPFVQQATRTRVVRGRRPSPTWFDYSPPPLRLAVEGSPVAVGDQTTEPVIEALIYDFGAVLLTYRLPLPNTLRELPALSIHLYDNEALISDARQRAQRIVDVIKPAIERPRLADTFEDYVIFSVTSWDDSVQPSHLVNEYRSIFARAIEAEREELSVEQSERSTAGTISYAVSDLAMIDWNAAILFDKQPNDVIAVLQHANVELLEHRILDQELDSILDNADETLSALIQTKLWPGFSSGRMLGRFASVQTDAAVMFEGVNNAIKLLGNQYLARVYKLAANRLDLPAWHESVQRKLAATESLYQKMSDATSTRRLETLEWVIIALIAISILLPFTPWYH